MTVLCLSGVGVLSGQLYATGGHDGPLVRKSVEVYDPGTNTWKQVADMNMCRRNAGNMTTLSFCPCGVWGQTLALKAKQRERLLEPGPELVLEMGVSLCQVGSGLGEGTAGGHKNWPQGPLYRCRRFFLLQQRVIALCTHGHRPRKTL